MQRFDWPRRIASSLERRFQQAGLDPQVFKAPEEDMALIVANVPEQKMTLIKEDQSCTAQLYGYPGQKFDGHVERIGATVSQDRRAVRVLFHLTDLHDQMKPGMFAEIGLGTDVRPALLVPAEAMLHVGSTDYLLIEAAVGRWRIAIASRAKHTATRLKLPRAWPPAIGSLAAGPFCSSRWWCRRRSTEPPNCGGFPPPVPWSTTLPLRESWSSG